MNLLVIGGSYFYGRVFVMEALKEHTVTVLNRGTYSMRAFGADEITGDRHDAEVLAQCTKKYDAVVDFRRETWSQLFRGLPGRSDSTC